MKTILTLCLALLVGVSAYADRRKMLSQTSTRLSSTSFLISEGFEGAGFETTSPNAWVKSGNVDENSVVGVSQGSQSCEVQRIGGSSTATIYWVNTGTGTNLSHVAAFFSLNCEVTNNNCSIFNFTTNGVVKNIFGMRTTGRVRLYSSDGVINASPADGFPAQTTTYVWLEIDNAAGTGNIEFSTTPVRVGSGTKYASFTAAQTGMLVNQIQLIADLASSTNRFDYLRVHTNALPSNPQ